MRDVTIAHDHRAPSMRALPDSVNAQSDVCVAVAGGPWEFRECNVRAAGGVAVEFVQRGEGRIVCASVGGVGGGWGDIATLGLVLSGWRVPRP